MTRSKRKKLSGPRRPAQDGSDRTDRRGLGDLARGPGRPEDAPATPLHRPLGGRRGFLGFLLGVIFFIPLLGLAVGAAGGVAVFKLKDVGIDDEFIDEVRQKLTPGTSALFALTQGAVEDPVVQAFSRFHAELIASNLSAAQEQNLREMFFAG